MVPDSLDGTVDQNDCKSPPLKVEDLALVGLREQGFAIARHSNCIGIE